MKKLRAVFRVAIFPVELAAAIVLFVVASVFLALCFIATRLARRFRRPPQSALRTSPFSP